MDTGVAQKPILRHGRLSPALRARLNPTTSVLTLAYEAARGQSQAGAVRRRRGGSRAARRDRVQRWRLWHAGAGRPRRRPRPAARARRRRPAGLRTAQQPHFAARRPQMVDFLYARLQRRGYLRREVERMVNQDRNIFARVLLALGEADAMITGVTRPYAQTMRQVQPGDRREARQRRRSASMSGRPDAHRVHRRHDGQRAAERRATGR